MALLSHITENGNLHTWMLIFFCAVVVSTLFMATILACDCCRRKKQKMAAFDSFYSYTNASKMASKIALTKKEEISKIAPTRKEDKSKVNEPKQGVYFEMSTESSKMEKKVGLVLENKQQKMEKKQKLVQHVEVYQVVPQIEKKQKQLQHIAGYQEIPIAEKYFELPVGKAATVRDATEWGRLKHLPVKPVGKCEKGAETGKIIVEHLKNRKIPEEQAPPKAKVFSLAPRIQSVAHHDKAERKPVEIPKKAKAKSNEKEKQPGHCVAKKVRDVAFKKDDETMVLDHSPMAKAKTIGYVTY